MDRLEALRAGEKKAVTAGVMGGVSPVSTPPRGWVRDGIAEPRDPSSRPFSLRDRSTLSTPSNEAQGGHDDAV